MVGPSLASHGFVLPSLPFPAPSRQGQPGPALRDDAETLRPRFAPGAEHLTGSGSSGGVPASQRRPQAGTRCATSASVLSPAPAPALGVSAPSPPPFQLPRGRAQAGRRSRGLRSRPQGPGIWSLPRVSFLLPQGAEGGDGEAKFWQQDVGRRRGGEGAGECRPCQEETTMSG